MADKNARKNNTEGGKKSSQQEVKGRNVHYTAFIKLPFPRGDFVDPPLVDWDGEKDQALWQILSSHPRSSELDWKELATKFGVTLPFILQQAAWLYERQLSQVRAQMRQVSKTEAKEPLQEQQSHNLSTDELQEPRNVRLSAPASIQQGPTRPTAQSHSPPRRQLTTVDADKASSYGNEAGLMHRDAPTISRTTSSNTVTQSYHGQLPRTQTQVKSVVDRPMRPGSREGESPSPPPSNSSSSSSSGSDDDGPPRGQRLRRPSKFAASRLATFRSVVNRPKLAGDEEEERPFLPFSQEAEEQQQDLGATVRGQRDQVESHSEGRSEQTSSGKAAMDSSASSAASSAVPVQPKDTPTSQRSTTSNPLSPQQRVELAALQARKKGKAREGSDGTPSMGGSFSDLDDADASVTQSALEEALLSNVQHGAATSRISNLSQALRSQYSRYQSNSKQP